MDSRQSAVVVIGTASVRPKTTGKIINEEWVRIFKYDQGRVVFLQEYMDTAPLVLEMS